MSIINNNKGTNKIRKFSKNILRKIVIISLPIIIIGLILAACLYFILLDDGTWEESEKGNPTTYTGAASLSGTDGITTDRNKIIKQGLLDLMYTEDEINSFTDREIIDILQMEKKLDRTINSLDECTNAEILWCTSDEYSKYLKKPEDLEKLLNAELITQYPKIDGLAADKLNGIIEFERHETDPNTGVENTRRLQYTERAQFTQKFEAYEQNGNRDVLNYFTLDDEGNLIIAVWSREEGQYYSNNTALQTDRQKIRDGMSEEKIKSEIDDRYTVTNNSEDSISATYTTYVITEQTIYYKSMVQPYTLPFEFLWALLVMGRSDEFVLNLSQLAYDSEITIGIFDNIDKTVTTEIEEYTEAFRERIENYEREEGESDYSIVSEEPSYNTVEHIRIEDNAPDQEWNDTTYSYKHQNIITAYTNTTQIQVIYADVWIVEIMVQFQNVIEQQQPYNVVETTEDEWWQDNGCESEYPDPTERGTGEYELIDGELVEKTKTVYKRKETYKYKRMVDIQNTSILDVTTSKYQTSPAQISEKTDIDPTTGDNFVKFLRDNNNAFVYLTDTTGTNWLCSILAANADTVGMVDLTRYLINKTKNPDDTRLAFDFSIYEPQVMSPVTGVYGGTIQEKVWFALKDLGYSDIAVAGAMGNIDYESAGFNPSAVEGGSGEGIGLIQWSFGRRTQLERYAASKGISWQDEDTQIEFLIAEISGQGPAASYATQRRSGYIRDEGITSTHNEWAASTSINDSTLYFMRFFESPGSTASLNDRITRANRYLQEFQGREAPSIELGEINLSEASKSKMQAMINEAVRIANDNRYTYSQSNRDGEFQYDCSSFVYRLYRQYFGISVPTTTGGYSASNYIGSPSSVTLQPGDVLWKSGHVVLYIGNGQIAEAYGRIGIATADQIRVTGYTASRFTKVYRFITN